MNTVRDRIAALGLDYPATNETAWRLGSLVRERYVKTYGHLPPKTLRDKTHDGGSHCFAIYPEEFFPAMDEVIRNVIQQDAHPTLPF